MTTQQKGKPDYLRQNKRVQLFWPRNFGLVWSEAPDTNRINSFPHRPIQFQPGAFAHAPFTPMHDRACAVASTPETNAPTSTTSPAWPVSIRPAPNTSTWKTTAVSSQLRPGLPAYRREPQPVRPCRQIPSQNCAGSALRYRRTAARQTISPRAHHHQPSGKNLRRCPPQCAIGTMLRMLLAAVTQGPRTALPAGSR